jgi:hypothetical protein
MLKLSHWEVFAVHRRVDAEDFVFAVQDGVGRRDKIAVQTGDNMCPACIASAAAIVAGAGSTGGILAVCISKFRRFFRTSTLGLFQKTTEK